MSIDSGGKTATMSQEVEQKLKDEKSIDDEELEDGELDSDDDEPAQPTKEQKSTKEQKNEIKSSTTTTNNKQTNKHQDDKSSNKFQSNKSNTTRKRVRRSGSEDSDDLDKRNRKLNRNNKQSNNRNKRPIASTDDESESDDDLPKIDQKMMFTMLKQMQEFFVNNSDKSSKHNKQEYDKFFERVKNNKSGQKEMMKFFKKNEKMMNNQSSHDNLPAMFNLAFNNPAFFPQGPPNAGMNMFNGGLQPSLPPSQQYQQQMNPNMLPPGPGNFPHGPFNGPPQFGGPCFNNVQGPPNNMLPPNQMQQFGPMNDLAPPHHNNSPSLMPQSLSSNNQNNKKQKKRKKMKEDKEDLDEISNKQICKYYLEGFCHKGNDCDFLHQQPYNYKKEVCKFYLQDGCHKGDNCTFLHKEFPCKLFHTGQDCILGENCKFSHEPMSEELKEIFINYLDNADLNEELNVAYGLSKNTQKKAPILGNVPEDVKGSYQTWVWQQEMKKLELAYTGTKRNLFCIDDIFVLKEKPPRDNSYDDEDEDEYAFFNKDIDERQSNFYFDTQGDMDDEDEDMDNFINEENPFTKDNDLRKEFAMNENSTPNIQPELKSLDEVKKQWLDNDSEDDLDQKQPDKEDDNNKKSSIDISKMLDVIRQTTNSQNNQASSTTTNSSSNNSEFWKTILNGVNLDDNEKTDQDEQSSFSINQTKPTTSQQKNSSPRDPRLLRQRHSQTKQQQPISSIQKILADEPFTWSHGDVDFKLYKIDVNKIDYSFYKQAFEIDSKLKNDPRLQNYFNSQQTNKSTSSSTNLNPTDVILAPLTLSQKNELSPTNKITIPPAPSSKLSAFDLISPSTKPQTPTNQLSFEEQILASVHISKEPTTSLTPGGLTSLADLVKSKKVNSSESTNN